MHMFHLDPPRSKAGLACVVHKTHIHEDCIEVPYSCCALCAVIKKWTEVLVSQGALQFGRNRLEAPPPTSCRHGPPPDARCAPLSLP